MRTIHFRELAAGDEVAYSNWFQITQTHIDAFADATNDHEWIHVDTERAQAGPLGTTIAHGYLTLSLIGGLLRETMRIDGAAFGINYGLNRVRFPTPVSSGAKVRLALVIVEATPRDPRSTLVRYAATIELADSEGPACVAETMVLYHAAGDQ